MAWRVTMSSKIPVVEMAGPSCGLLQGGVARWAGLPMWTQAGVAQAVLACDGAESDERSISLLISARLRWP